MGGNGLVETTGLGGDKPGPGFIKDLAVRI